MLRSAQSKRPKKKIGRIGLHRLRKKKRDSSFFFNKARLFWEGGARLDGVSPFSPGFGRGDEPAREELVALCLRRA